MINTAAAATIPINPHLPPSTTTTNSIFII